MKKPKKIVLKMNMKKLTLKMAEIINNKCDPSHISNFKRIYSLYTVGQHQKPTKTHQGVIEQFSGKKENAMIFRD